MFRANGFRFTNSNFDLSFLLKVRVVSSQPCNLPNSFEIFGVQHVFDHRFPRNPYFLGRLCRNLQVHLHALQVCIQILVPNCQVVPLMHYPWSSTASTMDSCSDGFVPIPNGQSVQIDRVSRVPTCVVAVISCSQAFCPLSRASILLWPRPPTTPITVCCAILKKSCSVSSRYGYHRACERSKICLYPYPKYEKLSDI